MTPTQILRQLASEIDQSWEDCSQVDWSEAEQLVQKLQALQKDNQVKLPSELVELLQYADDESEWDSGYVASWPQLILNALADE